MSPRKASPAAGPTPPPRHTRKPADSPAPGGELDPALVEAVAAGSHAHPHDVLGRHSIAESGTDARRTVIRTVRPLAATVSAVAPDGAEWPLQHVSGGLWQGPGPGDGPYLLRATYPEGDEWLADDPYRFAPTIGELDLYLWGEGRHETLWTALGAHLRTVDGVDGVAFTVWAPRARAVRLVGEFNGWNGSTHALRRLNDTGVWELFVPGITVGTLYKFEILGAHGWQTKADPMARATEQPPATASRVEASEHRWQDDAWMSRRAETDALGQPMSIYEMHLGSWRPGLGYRDVAAPLIAHLTALGSTHVEFLPLAEHPYGPSWGYQVTGYYAASSRWGSPDDLRWLIDQLHQAGFGVILDWVPGHFPKDAWALARFDGEALYEHPDPRRGEQPDWGTLVFDFGHPQVRNFLVANALYWLEEFHADGLRVDAVASMLYLDYSREEGQWLPNRYGGRENLEAISFLQEVNATAYKRSPGIVMIAEESTSWPGVTAPTDRGGLGFGLKWNMGWMHDSLEYIERDPMYRSHHHDEITFSLVYAWSEHFLLPISHDEVVHGKGSLYAKMPGDDWQKRANLRAYLAFQWAHPGKKLLFMGQEHGEYEEWSEQRGLDWELAARPEHAELTAFLGQLNQVYREQPALWSQDNAPGGFEWLESSGAQDNVVAFLRWDNHGTPVAVLINFSGRPVAPYRVGLPFGGVWDELINSDALEFGGSGVGNLGSVVAEDTPWMGRPFSAELALPPLGALWLKPRR